MTDTRLYSVELHVDAAGLDRWRMRPHNGGRLVAASTESYWTRSTAADNATTVLDLTKKQRAWLLRYGRVVIVREARR